MLEEGRWLLARAQVAQKKLVEARASINDLLMTNFEELHLTHLHTLREDDLDSKAFTQALEIALGYLSAEETGKLKSIWSLERLLRKQAQHVLCETILRHMRMLLKKDWGDDHPFCLTLTGWVATGLFRQERYEEAEKMHEGLLSHQKELLGDDHAETIITMNCLATSLHTQLRYEEAEKMYKDILQRKIRLLGADHPQTLATMQSLGLTIYNQERYGDAENMFEEEEEEERRARIFLADDQAC